jgi:hypothetical protein
MKFKIGIHEQVSGYVFIDADNEDDARELATDLIDSENLLDGFARGKSSNGYEMVQRYVDSELLSLEKES